jgi:hypothetical protein
VTGTYLFEVVGVCPVQSIGVAVRRPGGHCAVEVVPVQILDHGRGV